MQNALIAEPTEERFGSFCLEKCLGSPGRRLMPTTTRSNFAEAYKDQSQRKYIIWLNSFGVNGTTTSEYLYEILVQRSK